MKKAIKIFILLLALICITLLLWVANFYNLFPKKYYTAEKFQIETMKSTVDFNNNGVDDYTDILLGARIDAQNKPKYNGAYVAGGYPDDSIGVCTDVIWRAFKNAGYSLKDMVDRDIKNNLSLYPRVQGVRDANIDFRRVPNLDVFFSRFAESLTIDPSKIAEWQPGDIVVYSTKHIAIVSDRRNKHGIPYIIHNGGQPRREEDALTRQKITAHYRFDASKLKKEELIPFKE